MVPGHFSSGQAKALMSKRHDTALPFGIKLNGCHDNGHARARVPFKSIHAATVYKHILKLSNLAVSHS